jgi:hypothetical protein
MHNTGSVYKSFKNYISCCTLKRELNRHQGPFYKKRHQSRTATVWVARAMVRRKSGFYYYVLLAQCSG